MIKTVYFGPYSKQDVESMGIENTYIHDGIHYEFKVEIHVEDGFTRIYDSCKRMVPFDNTHYKSLYALSKILVEIAQLTDIKDAIDDTIRTGIPKVI